MNNTCDKHLLYNSACILFHFQDNKNMYFSHIYWYKTLFLEYILCIIIHFIYICNYIITAYNS